MTKFAGFCAGISLLALMAGQPALAEGTTAPAADATAAAPATAATMDTVLATVNGAPITLGDVIVTYVSIADQYKQMPDDALFKGILDQLIQQVALEQSVADKLTKKDQLVLELQKRNYLANAALDPIANAALTDDAMKAAYDAAVAAMPPETEYHASHILVDSEEKANKLKEEIAGGKSFADVAKENSTDGSAKNGGDLGWFGLGTMVKPFEEAVVAAKVGEVTGPIKTDFGWHLILVSETRQKAPPSMDDMKQQLTAQVESSAIRAYLNDLTAKATVTRTADGIDPALMKDTSLLDK